MTNPVATAASLRKGIGLMLLAILTFAAMDAVVKGLVQRYPINQVVWMRFAAQLVIVLAVLRSQTGALLRTRYLGLQVARAGLQLGTAALFFTSLAYIGLAEASALTDLSPVLITLGAALFLGEKLGPRRVFGVFAALAGALIVIRPGSAVFTPAALLPLGAALTYSCSALLTRWVGQRESPWTTTLYVAIIGTVVVGASLPFSGKWIALGDLPLVLLVGALGTFAQICLIRSYAMTEASVVAPFTYSGTVFATFWGIVLYGEYPDQWTVIGALVIIGAGIYVWHREMQAAHQAGKIA